MTFLDCGFVRKRVKILHSFKKVYFIHLTSLFVIFRESFSFEISFLQNPWMWSVTCVSQEAPTGLLCLPTAKCEIDWRTERATGAIKWEKLKLKLTLKPEKWHIIEKQLTRGKIKLNWLHHHLVEVEFGEFWNA